MLRLYCFHLKMYDAVAFSYNICSFVLLNNYYEYIKVHVKIIAILMIKQARIK